MNEFKNCPQCDAPNDILVAFCPYCGYKFDTNQPPVQNDIPETPIPQNHIVEASTQAEQYEALLASLSTIDEKNSQQWLDFFSSLLNISQEKQYTDFSKSLQIIFDGLRYCSQKELFTSFTNEESAITFIQQLSDGLRLQTKQLSVTAVLPQNYSDIQELLSANRNIITSNTTAEIAINVYFYEYILTLMTTFLSDEATQQILSLTTPVSESTLSSQNLSRIVTFKDIISSNEPIIEKTASSSYRVPSLIAFIAIQILNTLMLLGVLTTLFQAFNPLLFFILIVIIGTAGISTIEFLYGKTLFPQRKLTRIIGFVLTTIPYAFLPFIPYLLLVLMNNKQISTAIPSTKNTALEAITQKYINKIITRRELFYEIIKI